MKAQLECASRVGFELRHASKIQCTWKTCIGSIREKADLATKGEVVRRVGLSCVVLERRKEGSRRGKREGKREGERERERNRVKARGRGTDGGPALLATQ